METMDFKPGFEVFTSPRVRPRSEVAFNDMLMTNGFTGLFDDVFLGAESMHCDIFDELGENRYYLTLNTYPFNISQVF